MAERESVLAEFGKDDKKFKRPELRDVYRYVVPEYASKWRCLGALLLFEQAELETIFSNFRHDAEECCRDLLSRWLKKTIDASWDQLLSAIDNLPKFVYQGVDKEFQATLIAANDHLQKCYINSRYSPTVDEWPPYQPRHYTTLALIHHKDKCTNTTVISVTQIVAGKFQPKVEGFSPASNSTLQEPNIYSNATKNISDIFVSVTASDGLTINPCIILIEGAPGIGKTVLAKEIAFQWANNKLLKDKKILLLLFLRECKFNSMISVESFVQYVVKSNKITASLTEYLLQTEGKDLAIVFDGYDEVSEEDRKKSIIADIIYRRIFAKCCLVITSRPTASSNLHSTVDCRVEIVGFTEEDRLDYIQTALQGNDDKVKALTLYLQSNPTINALCYIPLNMTILLCLAEDGIENLPKTQTDMYKKFIEMTIVRFIQKIDTEISKVITSIAELPHPHDKVFEELTRLAYNALEVDKIVFRLNEIKEVCPNLAVISSNWNGLGLLKAVQHFNAEIGNVTFHFLHFSIQEYMAALYISTLSDNQQIKLLKKTFWEHRYYNTWIMYVGITCGRSFALKHFLSGNWFQLSTRIFKSLNISRKFLESKIKCLHLFQCLVESNNEDMIASVSTFFEGNQINLSNQTLLPSDVNTLGFFLIRSINKHWEMLNLSGCNIGSIGINILCDRFLSKESRDIVVINQVDFSSNELTFSSVLQIFDLLKSWHTLQLIIKDSEILQDHANSDVYKAIEDAFFTSNYDKQVGLELGSFLFGHKTNIFPMLLKTTSVKNVYLLNCTMTPDDEVSFLTILPMQNLSEIHLINTPLPNQLIKNLCSNSLSIKTNLFVYDPELSDQDADEICDLILSSEMTDRIMLIVSNTKIQGTINTSTISEQLTSLEIFNLSVNISKKGSDHIQTSPWKGMLCYDSNNDDLISNMFIELPHKITCNKWNWQLRIMLIEKDVLIAHRVNYECISEKTRNYQSLKAIYLSDCCFESTEYQMLFNTEATLKIFCIFNSRVGQNWLELLPFVCKEMFIHTLCDINIEKISYFNENHSTVLVMKDKMYASNPTTKQVTSALQLQPLIDVLKLLHCQNFDQFNQIITMLTTTQDEQMKLDFMNCKFGEFEFKILQRYLRVDKKIHSTIKRLNVSSMQFTELLVPKLIETLLVCKVQQLVFYDIDQTIYRCFATQFTTTITNDVFEEVFLLVTCNDTENNMYFCNYNWNKIIIKLLESSCSPIATLYIVNCHFLENLNVTELRNISKLYMINSILRESTIVNILETFIERNLEITICNTSKHIDDAALYNFITSKKLLYQSRINFVAVMENFICGYNATKYQFQFLLSQNLSNLEHIIVTAVKDTIRTHEKQIFVFQNKQLTALHFVGKVSEANFMFSMPKSIATLKWIGIDKYTITSQVGIDIANILSHNEGLEQLYFNSKLQTTDLLKIMQVLVKCINLKVLEIGNITDQITDYLTSIIFHNAQLQHFSVTNSYLCTANVVKISKALQNTSNLTITSNNTRATNITATNSTTQELYCLENSMQAMSIKLMAERLQNITALRNVHVRDDNNTEGKISSTFSCNTQLQEFDTDKNNFHTMDAIEITKALQASFTFKKLCISNNNITDEAVDDIAAAICNNTLLQELDVSKSNLQSTAAIKIAKALHTISTLTKLYINNNKITDKAADDIVTALSCNSQLQKLNINKNQFQTVGIIKISKGLQNISALKQLYISNNNITDEAVDDIAAAIFSNTLLQEFDVSKNYIKSTGAIKIAKALQAVSTLTKLYINNNYITDEAADDIATALSCNTQLQELNISKNCFQTAGTKTIIKALQSNCILKELCISNNNITEEAADDIAAAIFSNTQLQEFDVSKNCIKSIGAIKIAKALQAISTLTKLYINNNYITDEAADDIATVLSCNIQLKELDISENDFQTAGIITITKALQSSFALKKLCISNNNITAEADDDIAAVIYSNSQLQVFDVSKNYFISTGVIKIIKALRFSAITKLHINSISYRYNAADDIAAAVTCNTHLQELDISNNQIKTVKIAKGLQNNATLKKFYMSRIGITNEAADDIAAGLSFNVQLQELDISKNSLHTNGIKLFARVLQGSIVTLTKLYINDNGITDEAAGDIAAAICNNNLLEDFDVSKNKFQELGIVTILTALQSISTLTKLCISNNNITCESADNIAAIIFCNTQLQELDISNNKLQAIGVVTVVKALQSIVTLKKLFISYNICVNKEIDPTEGTLYDIQNTTEKAAYSIAEAVSRNTKLQEFDISENHLPIIRIMQALQGTFTIIKLYVSNNITKEAAKYIAAALSFNCKLQELDISRNQLGKSTVEIAKVLQGIFTLKKLCISSNFISDEAADDIAAAVSHSCQLEVFDISKNNIRASGMIKIARALQKIVTLRRLYINHNFVTAEASHDIAAVCSHNTQLQELYINSNIFTLKEIVELKDNCIRLLNHSIYIRYVPP